MLDEHGREMHSSWGNVISAEEAFERMGADVMRWQYCQQPPDRNLLFGYAAAHEIKGKLIRFWNSVKFFVDYAEIDGFRPQYTWLDEPGGDRPLDRWLAARTAAFVREATAAYEAYLSYRVIDALEGFLDDLSNWYIRRSRRRFWQGGDTAALRTLWSALVAAVRVAAPVLPFLSERLWRILVADACDEAPRSVHLAGWPEPAGPDDALLAEVAEVRRVVELGHQARGEAGVQLRQPLRRMFVRGASAARSHAGEIADELNVKEVRFDEGPVAQAQVKLNYPVVGPRLGARVKAVQAALDAGDYELPGDGTLRAAGEDLGPGEWTLGERLAIAGFALAEEDGLSVALDTALDEELLREKRVRDLIREINRRRKEGGLELTDRIVVTLPVSEADLVPEHGEWIKQETLAVELQVDGAALAIRRA
jgi:isoleucyl-tRNA synthetase